MYTDNPVVRSISQMVGGTQSWDLAHLGGECLEELDYSVGKPYIFSGHQ